MAQEKKVIYSTLNTYSTLNSLTSETKNVWLVFHGMGYLSKYFIKYFSHLEADENYIIAPQAPSKYYIGPDFKHVGASWLTRENTITETENVLEYIDAIYKVEKLEVKPNFIIMGYSQGVSIAMRWMSSRKISCDHLIIHSGGIPVELSPNDFSFFENKVTCIYGNKDQYINETRKTEQLAMGNKLFGKRLDVHVFDGIHEVNTQLLIDLVS